MANFVIWEVSIFMFHFASNNAIIATSIFQLLSKQERTFKRFIIGNALKFFFDETKIGTIYLGGGTPSLLRRRDYSISSTKHFDLSQVEEVTMEGNPDDLTEENSHVP